MIRLVGLKSPLDTHGIIAGMSNNNKKEELIKKADIQMIADKGKAIYESIKANYDPKEKGRFLAIDVDTKNVYLGETSAEAVESAKRKHPNVIFYVVKIGYDAAETMVRAFLENK
jgi:glycerol kinase